MAAAISGASGGVLTGFAAAGIDPQHFNLQAGIGETMRIGLAAAVILPLALAVLPVLFTPAERPRAIAIVGGATFLGYPVGPILGGWLLDHFWWGSVFLINVPVVMTREEVAAIISLLDGTAQLVAKLLYGSGLRIMEAVRVRVKDIDFQS